MSKMFALFTLSSDNIKFERYVQKKFYKAHVLHFLEVVNILEQKNAKNIFLRIWLNLKFNTIASQITFFNTHCRNKKFKKNPGK
jgi:hypothetical protein